MVLLALPDLSPALAVEILPKGLVVNRLLVNADGKTHDLVVGPNDPADHGRHPHKYQNTIIGRYANRIPVAAHPIARNGASATVQPLPNENARVSLHGGPDGFDVRDWTPLDPAAATLFSPAEKAAIAALPAAALFSLVSPDGDQGFPGTLLVEVLFALTPGSRAAHVGSLDIVYRAKLQDTDAVTPVNLTQHWGFNLDASLTKKGAPTPTLAGHTLVIDAAHTVTLDTDALATGTLTPIPPAPHPPPRLGNTLPASGIDSFHLFNAPAKPTSAIRLPLGALSTLNVLAPTPSDAKPLVELASPQSGLTLAFHSNQPGVQYYTANFFNTENGTRKPIHGWSGNAGDGYGPQTFAFLEFHEPLAAWSHPTIAATGDTLLASGELYNNYIHVDVLFQKPLSDGDDEE